MKTLPRVTTCVGFALAVLFGGLFSGCECSEKLIPVANEKGVPPVIVGPELYYVIFPRPFPYPSPPPAQFEKLLNDNPQLFKLHFYEPGKPVVVKGESTCLTAKQWEIIDKEAKESGATRFAGNAAGGKTCFNPDVLDPDAQKFLQEFFTQVNLFKETQAKSSQ